MPQHVTPPETLPPTYRQNIQGFREDLIQAVSKYAQPDYRKAFGQIANTFLPYLGLWALMIFTVLYGLPVWTTLLLSIPAAGFLVRIFILFHDCCHGAFFPSRSANRILGYISGIMVFTSYEDWKRTHIIHHAASGNLDRRGVGDIWTLTVDEYLAASRFKRLVYRLFRNPLLLFTVIPFVLFIIIQRFPSQGAKKRERNSVIFTNIAIAAVITLMSLTLGFQNYLLIQLPIIIMAASAGMWLFYVQHQYEDVYWEREQNWDLTSSGLEGSSYYKLPKVLQWIVGNIGLHHIHHVRANIPNYNLQRCYNEVPVLQTVKPLTIRQSLKSLWLNLWDEQNQKLVSFRSISMLPRLASRPVEV
ncbi:fatty acid desaturase [Methylomicrobium sp. Wu6]|uniref:fatty acid desaturase n=1 Tax=Methylomicrobium sp. Wu6 TaxID=3107928 RepID=UPI002DD64A72|nr:fatty acid desaturase [Methylomicrobium sp. Wu6]MEC4749624.1 fatty acid desaturase [Methylomicrobium sp. Wu6]